MKYFPFLFLFFSPAPAPQAGPVAYCITKNPVGLIVCPSGSTGPAGPQGIQGLPGPQGIPGVGLSGVALSTLPANSLAIGPLSDGTYIPVSVVNTTLAQLKVNQPHSVYAYMNVNGVGVNVPLNGNGQNSYIVSAQ